MLFATILDAFATMFATKIVTNNKSKKNFFLLTIIPSLVQIFRIKSLIVKLKNNIILTIQHTSAKDA